MALDWTAALLPSERPSWCSAAQVPVSPPNAFMLPSDSSVVIQDDKGRRVRRTARWGWEDGEWKVLVRKEVRGGIGRVEKSLPKDSVDNNGEDMGVSDAKRSIRMKEGKPRLSLDLSADDENELNEDESYDETISEDDPITDPDGWIYGDNKWEGQSSKGGIGKVRLHHFFRGVFWSQRQPAP
jgi:hypothetical protein